MTDTAPAQARHPPILWAAYLACSWTWCIGMFLPALLLRDAGWMGYAVFFLPNVIGAGAMGFVLRNPSAAERIVREHGPMAKVFSIVTLAFHVYWLAWVGSFVRDVFPVPETWLMVALAAGIAWAISLSRVVQRGAGPRAAAVLWLFGLGVLVAVLASPAALRPATGPMIQTPTHPGSAAWLMPVCVFGFMLCPYLDLTFLLARRSVEGVRGGRIAFGFGFWVMFPAMVGLTAIYAGPLIAVLEGRAEPTVEPWAGAAVLLHIFAQWIFTVRVHAERLTSPGIAPATSEERGRSLWNDPYGITTALVACIGAGLAGMAAPNLMPYAGLSAGEIGYRLFMGAYGLVFPVYVWGRMVPRRRRASHTGWAGACVLAAPFFWMGMIEREGIWLAPGMLIALVVPMLLREPVREPGGG